MQLLSTVCTVPSRRRLWWA